MHFFYNPDTGYFSRLCFCIAIALMIGRFILLQNSRAFCDFCYNFASHMDPTSPSLELVRPCFETKYSGEGNEMGKKGAVRYLALQIQFPT